MNEHKQLGTEWNLYIKFQKFPSSTSQDNKLYQSKSKMAACFPDPGFLVSFITEWAHLVTKGNLHTKFEKYPSSIRTFQEIA